MPRSSALTPPPQSSALPTDYAERVYAGVLGKLVGVYLGRPFEQWSHERIERELGEIRSYVHERRNVPLIVADDDLSGTFTFLRALPDHGNRPDLTAAEIGRTWLNYIIEHRTILWWGGIGMSTEHTAWHRLRQGIEAPASGSIRVNGRPVAEEIGAQIFIDGWGLICPGDPRAAASFARRAASVSHDGEAIHGAVVVAAMVAAAFDEADLGRLVEAGLRQIPARSEIARMVPQIWRWNERDQDWRTTLQRLRRRYGYEIYGTNCPMISNHAVIHLALAAGAGDLDRSLMVVNTAGYDTDCNSGNVGCLLGVRGGLAAFDASNTDWRGPVADRLYLPTADGGRCITDAARETVEIVNYARALRSLPPWHPAGGARFHFAFPGSVQGFAGENATVTNVARPDGARALALHCPNLAGSQLARALTPTFTPPEVERGGGYGVPACPTLHPGQQLVAEVAAAAENATAIQVNLCIQYSDTEGRRLTLAAPPRRLPPGGRRTLRWRVPATAGHPIEHVGLEVQTAGEPTTATVHLLALDWHGAPRCPLVPLPAGSRAAQAWVSSGLHHYGETPNLVADAAGLWLQGSREWRDYAIDARLRLRLAKEAGLAVRVQGLTRFYALLLGDDGKARLVKEWEGRRTVLAERRFRRVCNEDVRLELAVRGTAIAGLIDGKVRLQAEDRETDRPLEGGAAGVVLHEGTVRIDTLRVRPLP
jgi:ADP-ribosylglycohydrolase